METTAYIALSRQMVLRQRMDVIANDIANMTTTGFKAEPLLLEPVSADAGIRRPLAFVQDIGVVRETAPGSVTPTGNPLDLDLEGPGYFVADTAEGMRYTRCGQFQLNAFGELVIAAGDPVLDDGGADRPAGRRRDGDGRGQRHGLHRGRPGRPDRRRPVRRRAGAAQGRRRPLPDRATARPGGGHAPTTSIPRGSRRATR